MGLFKPKYSKVNATTAIGATPQEVIPQAPSPVNYSDLQKSINNIVPQVMESVMQQQVQPKAQEDKYIEKDKLKRKIEQFKEEIKTKELVIQVLESLI